MKKYALPVAICLIVVMVATVALAAAVKVTLSQYPVVGYGSGRAILNYAKDHDKTEIQVNCSGLIPETTYGVYLGDGGWALIGDFVARKNGKGHLHARYPGDVTGHIVAVNEWPSGVPNGFTILISP
ncbi:hypothetical protein ES702_02692 [subsurface metagenome]